MKQMTEYYNTYVIFGNKLGFVDLESLENLLNNKACENIILFIKEEPHKNVKEQLKNISSIKIIISDNPRKSAKRYKKEKKRENRDLSIGVFSLEHIADRSLWHDVC